MKNMNNSENAMQQGQHTRTYPMVEIFPFAGKIRLSESAQHRLGVQLGERIETGCFNEQLFLRKATCTAGYLLRPVPNEDANRVEFTSQLMLKAGQGTHTKYELKGCDMPEWFELVAVQTEREVRNG